MNFSRFLHSETGKILISIVLGLGLATLFRKSCKGKGCYKFIGPSLKDIENKQFKFDGKCYAYKEQATSCDKNKKRVHFS